MKNWTIAKRITAGGATLLGLLLIISAVAFSSLNRLEQFSSQRLRDDAIPGIIYSADIMTESLRDYIRVLMAAAATTPALRDENISKSDANIEAASKAMDSYEASITSNEDRQNFADLKEKRVVFQNIRAAYLKILATGTSAEASVFEHEKLEPAYFTFREQILKMLKWNEAVAVTVTNQMVATAQHTKFTTGLVSGFSIFVALALGWIIIRSTNRVLQETAVTLDDASAQVAAAAAQVSGGSQSLADGSSEQAASLEESSSSLEELSSMTKRNADSAHSAKGISGETRAAADAGNRDMAEMRQAMDAIKTSSNDIAKIIKTIDEIAFQTNILALNAAVEAARAGSAGAGFAVVADEVRALAQRSANSARETASKIEVAIQNSDHGVRISEQVAASLGIIVEKARKVDELVNEISTASSEQSQGIGQISTAVSQMDQITQTNAANAEETAAAAEELTAQSASLKDIVSHLRELVGGSRSQRQPAVDEPINNANTRIIQAPARSNGKAFPTISIRPSPRINRPQRELAASASGHADAGNFFKDA